MSEAAPSESSIADGRCGGRFDRVATAAAAAAVVAGARVEGRFPCAGRPALDTSPRIDGAERATGRCRSAGDPPRVAVPLRLAGATVVDLHDRRRRAALAIDPCDVVAEWRRQGSAADSWRPADAVRAGGMIYPSRTSAFRRHLVRFGWNTAGAAEVTPAGPPIDRPVRLTGVA